MNTYNKALNFIKNATKVDLPNFYKTIRQILETDLINYPEDWQINDLERKADKKYESLEGAKES